MCRLFTIEVVQVTHPDEGELPVTPPGNEQRSVERGVGSLKATQDWQADAGAIVAVSTNCLIIETQEEGDNETTAGDRGMRVHRDQFYPVSSGRI
jgi:hypothetical protein